MVMLQALELILEFRNIRVFIFILLMGSCELRYHNVEKGECIFEKESNTVYKIIGKDETRGYFMVIDVRSGEKKEIMEYGNLYRPVKCEAEGY